MNLLKRGVLLLFILGNVTYAENQNVKAFLKAIKDGNLTHVKSDLKQKEVQESLKNSSEAIDDVFFYLGHVDTVEELKNREKIVLSLLDAGVDMYHTYMGRTLLEEAIKENYYELVKYLLEKGDIKKFKTPSSEKNFFFLIGGKPALDLLMKKKLVDLNYRDYNGDTVLHHMLSRGLQVNHQLDCKNLGVLSKLINVENNQGYTPLDKFVSYVSNKEEYQCFTDILKQLKSIKDNNEKMSSLLDGMMGRDFSLKTYELAIEKMENIDFAGYKDRTALFIAIENRNDDIVKLLLNKNANVKTLDSDGNSLLMVLIKNDGKESMAQLLINKGVDINIINEIGETALFLAKEKNMTKLVQVLEKKNAKILSKEEIEKNYYLKEYMSALKYKNVRAIKNLIRSHKVDINTTVNDGESPLSSFMRGSGAGDTDRLMIINFFIDEGIDLNLGNDTPESLLGKAFDYNRIGIAQKLMKRGAKLEGSEVMSAFTYLKDKEFIFKLLKQNPKLLTGTNMFKETLLTDLGSDGKKNLKFFNQLLEYMDVKSEKKDGTYNTLFRLVEEHGDDTGVELFVKSLLSHGYSTLTKLNNGKNILMVALESSANIKIVKVLLNNSNGVLNAKSNDGRGLGHFAALAQKDVLEYMINLGIKVGVHGGKNDGTPLILAVQKNRPKNIKLLLDKATINHEDKYGKTALNYAMEYDYSFMFKTLENAGAIAKSKEHIEKMSTLYALEKKEPKKLEKILKDANGKALLKAYKKVKKEEHDDFIDDVLAYGDLNSFKMLLENGLDIKYVDKASFSLLALAVFNDNMEIVKYLLNKKLDINALSKEKRSVFLLSANSSVSMMGFLLKQGIKTKTDKKDIVSEALRYNNEKVASYLVKHGFPLGEEELSDDYIRYYIRNGKNESVEFLLSHGLDINHKVHYAFHKEPLLIHAIVSWENEVTKLLISKGADIHALIEYDSGNLFKSPPTALSAAIQRGNKEMVALLLEKGAKVDSISKEDDIAPLMVALQNRHAQIAQMIIAKGCDVNVINEKNKMTPLMYASYYGYIKTVKMLIEHGARVKEKNIDGKTAYDFAKDNGYELVYEYLESK